MVSLPPRLHWLLSTTVGQKALVAVTGVMLLGFLAGHLLGNLLYFQGRDELNGYAAWLQGSPLVWPARIGLLAVFVTHVTLTLGLARRNRASRPARYAVGPRGDAGTVASRGMLVSGLVVMAFVVFHLLHFTLGVVDADAHALRDATGRPDVRGMVTMSYGRAWIAGLYVAALALLGTHLAHGVKSLVTTLGIYNRGYGPGLVFLLRGAVALMMVGFVTIPIYAFFFAGGDPERGDVMIPDPRVPQGPLDEKWDNARAEMKLVSPNNKRHHRVVVVGSGLAGASAAATLADLGYKVDCFCYQDSPRRAHSVAAQGGINAAKNYRNDGDSVHRLFLDTVKGGDFRSREANVYRLAQVSTAIIDQCVAQGVPFAREYGGLLDNRSFGGAQVSRTFYARGQTGQQLLLGCYSALARQIAQGGVRMHTRTEMMDVVVVDGHARGIVTRDLVSGKIERWPADAVVLASGGYGNVFYLSTNAAGCNVTATYRAYRRGALFANPCMTQIHPTCIPASGERQSKLTLMSESLRNDGRIWVPQKAGETRAPGDIPEGERDYYLERRYPSFGNLSPRDIASRAAKEVCDEGRGIGPLGRGVYLDFKDAMAQRGADEIADRYGNLFEMYERITGEDPYRVPMRIYPAVHYTMGGLWVDYNLMSSIPGLFVIGEANFSDHGANRLGASALMQGLADGYFIVPDTIGDYLGRMRPQPVDVDGAAFTDVERDVRARIERLLGGAGKRSVDHFHRALGKIMWERCGMARNARGLQLGIEEIRVLREEYRRDLRVVGAADNLNSSLERAGRVDDFMGFAELMCHDALQRDESCGAHFREEHQTSDGEAQRDDERFCHVAAWQFRGVDTEPVRHVEELEFESVELATRSYK